MSTNPAEINPFGQDYGDHTTGSGLMMAVNGSTVPDVVVWAQTVPIDPHTSYEFSAWASIWTTGFEGNLDFLVNGSSIGTFSSYPRAAWGRFSQTLYSGDSSSFNISIIDRSLGAAGNDFALDDISLAPVPEPSSLGLVGLALMICAYHRQRRRVKIGRTI